jgi:hypothetical protein
MRRIVLSPMACPAVPASATLSHKSLDFREKLLEYKTFVLIFCTILYGNFLIVVAGSIPDGVIGIFH